MQRFEEWVYPEHHRHWTWNGCRSRPGCCRCILTLSERHSGEYYVQGRLGIERIRVGRRSNRHAGHPDHAIGNHHGHQPGCGHGQRTGGPDHLHRQPQAIRYYHQITRRVLYQRRARYRNVRRLDQSLLCTDYRGSVAGALFRPNLRLPNR